MVRSATSGIGIEIVLADLRRERAAANDDDQFGRKDEADQRADRRIFQCAGAQLGKIDVEHHDDKEEENRHSADIDDQQDHRQEFSARQQEQAGGIEEGQDQEQHGMDRVPGPDHHEGRRHGDEGEKIEKKSLQTHVGAFFIFPGRWPGGPCPTGR